MSSQSELIQIDVLGDIIMVCTFQYSKIRLQVSSKVLAAVSDVLRALFEPFISSMDETENQTSNSTEIDLPGDAIDTETFTHFCNILHLANGQLPERISSASLLGIATLARKYNCTVAVQQSVMLWAERVFSLVRDIEVILQQYDLSRIVIAAYILGMESLFMQACRELVVQILGCTHIDGAGFALGCMYCDSMEESDRKRLTEVFAMWTNESGSDLINIYKQDLHNRAVDYIDNAFNIDFDTVEKHRDRDPHGCSAGCRVGSDFIVELVGRLRRPTSGRIVDFDINP